MTHKNIDLTIFIGHFQEFDHGQKVTQTEENLTLSPGDTFSWECAQFYGTAEVVSYEDDELTFKKIS